MWNWGGGPSTFWKLGWFGIWNWIEAGLLTKHNKQQVDLKVSFSMSCSGGTLTKVIPTKSGKSAFSLFLMQQIVDSKDTTVLHSVIICHHLSQGRWSWFQPRPPLGEKENEWKWKKRGKKTNAVLIVVDDCPTAVLLLNTFEGEKSNSSKEPPKLFTLSLHIEHVSLSRR